MALGRLPILYIWEMNTIVLAGSFTTAAGDEEWVTTCVYELGFILRELINDKLYVIYILGGAEYGRSLILKDLH